MSQTCENILPEKDMAEDVLSSEKSITSVYNTFANECATPEVRDEFMSILNEEHMIQADVFDEMKKRSWYCPAKAEQQKIQQAKVKYENSRPKLQ